MAGRVAVALTLAVSAIGCGDQGPTAQDVERQVTSFYGRERPDYVAREIVCVREEGSDRSFRCGGEVASAWDNDAAGPLVATVLVDDGRYLVSDQTDYQALEEVMAQNAREREQAEQARQEAEEEAQQQAVGEVEDRLAVRIAQDFAAAAEEAGANPRPDVFCGEDLGAGSEITCRVSFTFGMIPGDAQPVNVTVDGGNLDYDGDAVRAALNAMADARGG